MVVSIAWIWFVFVCIVGWVWGCYLVVAVDVVMLGFCLLLGYCCLILLCWSCGVSLLIWLFGVRSF